MKNLLVYIPLALIFIIQIFDKEDKFLLLQIVLLLFIIFYTIVQYRKKMNK